MVMSCAHPPLPPELRIMTVRFSSLLWAFGGFLFGSLNWHFRKAATHTLNTEICSLGVSGKW